MALSRRLFFGSETWRRARGIYIERETSGPNGLIKGPWKGYWGTVRIPVWVARLYFKTYRFVMFREREL